MQNYVPDVFAGYAICSIKHGDKIFPVSVAFPTASDFLVWDDGIVKSISKRDLSKIYDKYGSCLWEKPKDKPIQSDFFDI